MFQSREDIIRYIEKECPWHIDDIILVDGHEESFCGIVFGFGGITCAVYDIDGVKNSLMSDGMSEEEAEEWFEFNMIGAYVGENTPMYIRRVDAAQTRVSFAGDTNPAQSMCTGNHPVSLN